MFSKKYTTISQISNLITPKEPKAHHASARNCEAKRTSLLGKHRELLLMCFQYSMGSLKTHSNDLIYHMIAKTLKFSTIKNETYI